MGLENRAANRAANYSSQLIQQGSFNPEQHWYSRAFDATIHPIVDFFMRLHPQQIVSRYCNLHPNVKESALHHWLSYQPKYLQWAGTDLIHVMNKQGNREMLVIENNSCPSGQKYMPLLDHNQRQGGYRTMMEHFKPILSAKNSSVQGSLAVVYDKNTLETSGYAAALADVMNEPVHYVPFYEAEENPAVRFNKQGIMQVWGSDQRWHPIRAAFRYLTQRPWNRVPLRLKTQLVNPIIACLAGGRNKMMAAKAYDIFNGTIATSGLKIQTPETIWNVRKEEVPIWVKKMGGQAVIKVPYSNAGQGVFTVINEAELEAFMRRDFPYQLFIVQHLIGHYQWRTEDNNNNFYHIGTVPNALGESYVSDLRIVICATEQGIRPVCMYSRRAKQPLSNTVLNLGKSWEMLGTNLSIRKDINAWDFDVSRLLLMDQFDFDQLGLGLDDLVEGYVQSLLSMIAIDQMAQLLVSSRGAFNKKLFKSLNNDTALLQEMMW